MSEVSDPASWLTNTSLVRYFLYNHASHPGQTPKVYYLWSFLTALAALVRDKFYYYKFPTVPMLPNLTTFLVGPSGLGKGTAINAAVDYLTPYKDPLRMFVGRTTHSAWMKYVTAPRLNVGAITAGALHNDNGSSPAVSTSAFLVTEELAFGLGTGERAKEFIRMWTQAYTQTGRDFEENTQAFGHHSMKNSCWSWLAGTTKVWMLDSLGIANILSGFASRSVWVIEDYQLNKLCSWAIFPPEFEEIKRYIEYRIALLMTDPGGEVKLSPGARFELDKWFAGWSMRAQNESEKALLPLYMRGHDLALKLGMLLRAADMDLEDEDRLYIRHEEIMQACLWVEHLLGVQYPRLLAIAYKGGDQEIARVDDVEELIERASAGTCTRSVLCKKAHNKGINAKTLDLALKGLMEQRRVELVPGIGGKGGFFRKVEKR